MEHEIKYYKRLEQGTDEWLKLRMGIVTASCVSNLITPTGELANNKAVFDYALELAIQREAKILEDNYQSFDMQRGHFQETIARDIYSENFSKVEECGFIVKQFDSFKIGASPDGLIDDIGGIEIKSRLSKFQIKTIIAGEVPEEYIDQIQCCLLVSERPWWDFVQYSNGLPLFVKRVYPDYFRMSLIVEACRALEVRIVEAQELYRENSKRLIKTERVELNFNDDILESA